MSTWSFYNPVQLHVGRGCRKHLVTVTKKVSILIVTTARGRRQFESDNVLSSIVHSGQRVCWVDSVTENPGVDFLQQEIDRFQNDSFDVVIAFGGGSAIDAAKVLTAALVPANKSLSLLELIQSSVRPILGKPLLYVLPTTSGTGSEVTPFATIWDHANKKKLSLTGLDVFPSMALVDADLTATVPIPTTLSTGLDTINQAAESIWNKNANPITLSYAYKALQLAMPALPKLMTGSSAQIEKECMAEASVLAGLAISHTRTALCHSISYPLTAHFGVPHGLACAFTMPAVLRHNVQAEDGRFAELSLRLTGSTSLDSLLRYFEELHEVLNVRQQVKSYIPSLDDLLLLQAEMVTLGRADNNLCDYPDLEEIVRKAWGE